MVLDILISDGKLHCNFFPVGFFVERYSSFVLFVSLGSNVDFCKNCIMV